jgi:hypothetical protein
MHTHTRSVPWFSLASGTPSPLDHLFIPSLIFLYYNTSSPSGRYVNTTSLSLSLRAFSGVGVRGSITHYLKSTCGYKWWFSGCGAPE